MKKSKRKLIRKVRPTAYGRKPEIDYLRDLMDIVDLCQEQGQSSWKMIQGAVFIGDSAYLGNVIFGGGSYLGDAPWWVDRVAQSFNSLGAKVRSISGNIAAKVVYNQADLTDKEIATHIQKATGIDIGNLVSASKLNKATTDAITANVSLIESIPTEYHQRLERIILSALQEGRDQSYIAEQIQKLGNTTEKRAMTIARDQTGKLASTFSEIRLKALGFDSYLWETKGDSKVRPVHARRRGISFKFDDPPYDGHAGMPINCRCRKMPDYDSLMNNSGSGMLKRLIEAGSGLLARSQLN